MLGAPPPFHEREAAQIRTSDSISELPGPFRGEEKSIGPGQQDSFLVCRDGNGHVNIQPLSATGEVSVM